MASILTGIDTLEQHQWRLLQAPDDYRPPQCPRCGKAGLWRHGCYGRKADRSRPACRTRNPVPVPRFRCRHCRGTCSTLPECLPPRRWYLWSVQQAALILLLTATSLLAANAQLPPSRKTLRRWWQRFKAGFIDHAACLRERLPELGRTVDLVSFWQACLAQLPLSRAMAWVRQGGASVP